MADYFVTRHEGALEWARNQGIDARRLEHLDMSMIKGGDLIMGTLPVPLIADICLKGARYLHLSMTVPPELRGQELNAQDMERFGARLEEFNVQRIEK